MNKLIQFELNSNNIESKNYLQVKTNLISPDLDIGMKHIENSIYYKFSKIGLKPDYNWKFIFENLEKVLSPKNLHKYLNQNDFIRLENLLPENRQVLKL